jgi:hypothetical protein
LEFDGEFETHLTIRADDLTVVEAAREWCVRHNLKFLHIVLDQGRTASQPMISFRGNGRLTSQLATAVEITRQLIADGFAVTRTKVEAAPGNRDIPQFNAEAVGQHCGRYFEHHVKLALGPSVDFEALAALARRHSARLSRNALRDAGSGVRERFVTQRCAAVGRPIASQCLHELLTALTEAGYPILDVEEEFVVYDSNLDVDFGWLDNGGGP